MWSSLVAVSILVLVVDDVSASFFKKGKSKDQYPAPLYGIVLHGHPYPKRLPSVPTPLSSYLPYYPNAGPARPPYYPPPPPATYQPLPAYQQTPVPVAPNYKPSLPPYQPPVVQPAPYQPAPYQPAPYQPPPTQPAPYQPAPYQPPPSQPAPYQPPPTQPTPYQPPPTQPAPYQPPPTQPAPYQPRPQLPVPTTFDDKPWQPITTTVTSAQYVLDPNFQVNEVDGYPWTEELYEGPDTENFKTRLPEILFYPNKSLAQQHAAATNIEFNPHPERKPFDDLNNI